MQIDFHHAVTYVCARCAGFEDKDASTIAYAAQYVDDATNSGLVRFDNGAMFRRISSAHKLFDYRNFRELANYDVWIPFHFLPGNGGLPAGKDPSGGFIEKLICRADSPIAREMVQECVRQAAVCYGLHRLGITMHVYADTWAHQGFAGVNHRINEAQNLRDGEGKADFHVLDRLKSYLIGETMPLGHGAVLGNPDKPFKRWGYTNGRGEEIFHHNPKAFLLAADGMCQVMQNYLGDEPIGLLSADRAIILQLFEHFTDNSGRARHARWVNTIGSGIFSFGPAKISYRPKGEGSWKYQALGTREDKDSDSDVFPYSNDFLTSDWKLFHDALQAHHFYVIHELLPRYGICVA
jgi:hypothetical protein